MIYLDNAATMQVYPEAISTMDEIYSKEFFNPSSTYPGGIRAKRIVESAREKLSKVFNCNTNELYFTSCATEANNWAVCSGFKNRKGNIVVSAGEHSCVYECAKELKNKGLDVRFANLNSAGTVDEQSLLSLVDDKTCLVSVIHVSNETGVINDLAALSRAVKSVNKKVIFHSDGVQAFLKTDNNVFALGVDMYSVSGHKVGAPKGIGALYISSDVSVRPFIFGGGQEGGMRSGTENVAGIAAFGVAVDRFREEYDEVEAARKCGLLRSALKGIEGIKIIGESAPATGMITAVSISGIKSEIIQSMCADDGVIIGRGSACSSRRGGNRVLQAMGLTSGEIDGALRLSISPEIKDDEITEAVAVIARNTEKLRGKRIG